MSGVSPGMTLAGRYKLTDHVAAGGMGEVWRGQDEVLARTVAVKIMLPSLVAEPGFVERFRDEARTMATISHPGVVNVYDYGADQGLTYLVMEYVEGDALSKTLARVGRLTPGRTMSLIAQAADALQAAHDKGIVHRDVKPANLLVRPNGTLVLTDFGIARSGAGSNLTAVGAVLGTASYISPEQASGHVATPASDVYALGVVAYQCLAGRRPFEGGSPIEIALQHIDGTPPPLPPDIPAPVRAVVERCIAKQPAQRWPSAASLAAAARLAATGQPVGRPTSPAVAPVAAGAGTTAVVRPQSVPPRATVQPQYRSQQAYQQTRVSAAPAQRKPAPPPRRSNAGVIILGIVLAVLVVVLAALVAHAIRRKQLIDKINQNGAPAVSIYDHPVVAARRVSMSSGRDLAIRSIAPVPTKVNAGLFNDHVADRRND
jgi:eukaryotic-like serine/threonine-protein kinase